MEAPDLLAALPTDSGFGSAAPDSFAARILADLNPAL